ncbi:MAG: CotH kinase family protein [Oscillospiraceae bacterium]|nr:CotH kinase family protein [Oscillospiraceae bacterium]
MSRIPVFPLRALFLFPVLCLALCLAGCGGMPPVVSASTPTAIPDSVPVSESLPSFADNESSMETPLGPLMLSEITVAGGDTVELYNCSDRPVRLSDYYLSDKNSRRQMLRLPEESLEPGGFYLCEELALSVKGDRVWLSDADGIVLDYARVEEVPVGGSYGRIIGESGWFFFTAPSLGAENTGGYRRVSPAPAASLASGVYEGKDSLTLALDASAGTIYYTTDGQAPTTQAEIYTEPLTLDKTTVVRALCVEEDAAPSRIASFHYILNEGHVLPVLSFTADSRGEWFTFYHDAKREREITGHAAYFRNGQEVFSGNCGIQLKGFTAVQDPIKKNFCLYFRGRYGDGDLENCDLFGNGVTEYGSLLVRAGQDHHAAIIRNELMEELCRQSTDVVPCQHYEYCVLYLNGQYAGIFALQENMNEQFFADWYGVSPESVTTLRQRDAFKENEDLQETIRLCLDNDMADETSYAAFCQRFDIDNFIDYILIQGYGGNTDLLENVRYFKSSELDNRWRLALFDQDRTFYTPYCGIRIIFEGFAKQARELTQMSNHLLDNPDFRTKVLTRYRELINTTLADEHVLAEIDRLAARIEPEVRRDRAACGISYENWAGALENLRQFPTTCKYAQVTVDTLCQDLQVTEEERALYFPGFFSG